MGRTDWRAHDWIAAGIAGALVTAAVFAFGPEVIRRTVAVAGRAAASPAAPGTQDPSPEPGLGDLVPLDSTSKLIASGTGGALDAPGGLGRLAFAGGALARDTRIEIARYAVDHPAATTPYALDLRPDGLTLARPAELAMPIPPGLEADEVEIAVFDPRREEWVAEPVQRVDAESGLAVASIAHFSLRRLRIRPGLDLPYDPQRARGTFYMETDAGNTFEMYVEGRWRAYRHGTPGYRDLMQLHRSGRHSLIVSGRLRAVTGARPRPEVFRDGRRTVAMPSGAPEARTGWVRLSLLDAEGNPFGPRVIARVNDYGPGLAARRAGVIVDMTRATMEALGLEWERDFGVAGDHGNLAWIRWTPPGGERPLRHVPVKIEAYRARTGDVASCRLP